MTAGDKPVTAPGLARWMRDFARAVTAHKDLLTSLDSAIGDGDHGTNMDRGMTAVLATLDSPASEGPASEGPVSPAALLKQVGMSLVSKVGGASGPLYGTFFLRMAAAVGTADTLDDVVFGAALRAGLVGVMHRGKAEPGDKTMVDALAPAVDAFDAAQAAGAGLGAALRAAASAADVGRESTAPMLARKGRASYLGERSIGHVDPGASSAALLITAAATAFGDADSGDEG